MGMKRARVTSSNLATVGYDEPSRTLEVEFHHGRVYRYFGVPPEEYRALMGAESHGKYFAANIRGRYGDTRVG